MVLRNLTDSAHDEGLTPSCFLAKISDELGCVIPSEWRELDLETDLNFDSLLILELLMVLEEALDIWLDEDAITNVRTLGELYECCRGCLTPAGRIH